LTDQPAPLEKGVSRKVNVVVDFSALGKLRMKDVRVVQIFFTEIFTIQGTPLNVKEYTGRYDPVDMKATVILPTQILKLSEKLGERENELIKIILKLDGHEYGTFDLEKNIVIGSDKRNAATFT